MAEDDPLWRHLIMAAPVERREALRLAHRFDLRLADLIRTTTEPAIGQMRLAWWDEALTGDGSKGRGEPLVEAMWAAWPAPATRGAMTRMVDGWEALLLAEAFDAPVFEEYGAGRGALFDLVAGEEAPDWIGEAGAAWALWDLSGHVSDPQAAALAIAMAKAKISDVPRRGWPKSLAPLRQLTGLVRADALAGRAAPPRMTPRQYLRLLRLSLTGGG